MPQPRRLVVCADNHGDMQNDRAVDAILGFNEAYKPQVRVHLGDNWDFRNLRRGASDEEKRDSLEDDWLAGISFVKRFFKGGKENYFLRGNHDERVYNAADACSGMARDYAHDCIKRMDSLFKNVGAKVLPYDSELGVLELGQLSLLHGYFASQNAVANHARTYGDCVIGHLHGIETATVPSRNPATATCIGSLCNNRMRYLASKPGKLKHRNGFGYGLLFDDGTYLLNVAKEVNGRFVAPTDFRFF